MTDTKRISVSHDTAASILATGGASASLKRIAWAYGCAKKGSDEEEALRRILVAKVRDTNEPTT